MFILITGDFPRLSGDLGCLLIMKNGTEEAKMLMRISTDRGGVVFVNSECPSRVIWAGFRGVVENLMSVS